MVRWEALVVGDLLQADEAEEFSPHRVLRTCRAEENTIKSAARLEFTGHLLIGVSRAVPGVLTLFP